MTSIGSAAVHKQVAATWVAAGLNDVFTAYWPASAIQDFTALNDSQAGPEQPRPFCVFEIEMGGTPTRMAGRSRATKFEIRDLPCQFRVHTRPSGTASAKELAATLAASIMGVFGGHPTTTPTAQSLSMDHGTLLIAQYLGDYGVREGDEDHQWIIRYNLRTDVPVTV